MNKITYLNIGGKRFEVGIDTLNKCSYFSAINNMNGEIVSSPETPYFIDRDPKIFRHVLNLLRDANYKYPEKYQDELLYYGVNNNVTSFDGNKLFIFENDKINQPSSAAIVYSDIIETNNIPESVYVTGNPQITFLRSIYRRHTSFEPPRLTNYIFNTNEWKHSIQGDFSLSDIELLLPVYFIDKLEYFDVTVSYLNDSFTFNLKIVEYIQELFIKENFVSIILSTLFLRDCFYIYINLTPEQTLTINLSCSYPETITSVLKLKTIRPGVSDYNSFYRERHTEHLAYSLQSYEIIDSEFILPVALITYIVFNIDYDFVTLEHFVVEDGEEKINPEHSFTISKFDAMHSYKDNGTGANDFPENWGMISFKLENLYHTQPCGHLESDGNYRIVFHGDKKNTGRIWISKFIVIEADSSQGYLVKKDKFKKNEFYL